MGVREVGGTVVKVALGAAAGVALMLARDGARGPAGSSPTTAAHANESSGRPRAASGEELARLEPASAPALRASDDVAAVVERDPVATPVDPVDGEIARLHAQVIDLEAEIARLRAQLADGSLRRRALHEMLAVNDLVHGKLYEEMLDLIVNDPESVAEDPRHAFALILRLIDETGLAPAELDQGIRMVAPEPNAPDLRLLLRDDRSECQEYDRPDLHWYEETIHFHAALQLPKVPEGWSAQPLDANVSLDVTRSDRGSAGLELTMAAGSLPGLHQVRWSLEVSPESACLTRSPWRCGEDSRDLPLEQVATEWRWIVEVFDSLQLRTR
jgi:hypothetical protein